MVDCPRCPRPEAFAARRIANNRFPHLDALYALAYLSSGDPDGAQQKVIDAFTDLCRDPASRTTCRARLWRNLADHVHLANQELRDSPSNRPAPFRDNSLPAEQREALALRLGGRRDRESAQLLGVSLARFLRHVRAGLVSIQATRPSTVGRSSCPEGSPLLGLLGGEEQV